MNKLLTLLVASLTIVAIGCQNGPKKPDDLPNLYPVTIKVVYDDGSPVADAQVALRNPNSGGGRTWNLAGVTDATGTLVLKTDGNWPGAPAGTYQAMVTKEVPGEAEGDPDSSDYGAKTGTRYVDLKYGDPTTSGLSVEVKEGENNVELNVGEKKEETFKMLG